MAGNLGLLARLRLRHLRGDARFLLFAVGTDIDEDRGFLERAYQAYLAIILAASLALSWAQVIDIVGGLRAAIGEATSSWLASALLLLAPALAILAWGVSGIRETPIRLSGPDMAWLARVVRPEELFVVQLAGSAAGIAAAGALVRARLGRVDGPGRAPHGRFLAFSRYPSPFTVTRLSGCEGSASIFSRRRRTWVMSEFS